MDKYLPSYNFEGKINYSTQKIAKKQVFELFEHD